MEWPRTLQAACGWLELGIADEAVAELQALPVERKTDPAVLEIRLLAEMELQQWNAASDTARLLCLKVPSEAEFFLKAAYCLHETGDTPAACHWLLRGPRQLFDMPHVHYNLACYLWTLGETQRARTHLTKAFSMDESLREFARQDRDLRGLDPSL